MRQGERPLPSNRSQPEHAARATVLLKRCVFERAPPRVSVSVCLCAARVFLYAARVYVCGVMCVS